ncbi:MAG: pyrimidine 5'-nucleotidase [Sphingorhabdus sp.]
MNNPFGQIENWVFDLDNTLYPPECGLYQYMDARIRRFVARALGLPEDEAHRVQKGYFRSHGTTLAGMMADHDTDPYEYLEDVHQFPLEKLGSAPRLAGRIAALPGRKIIFTNADAPYARRALAALELDNIFEIIVDIHACNYSPKPSESAYDTLLDLTGINPARTIFFEDMARNLAPAKARGMTTVWINNGSELGDLADGFGHVDHQTDNLAAYLDDAIEALETQAA